MMTLINKELHRQILFKILKDIYSDVELLSILGFKGGTAAMIFYELPRFSVDLDFDLLDAGKENLVYEKLKKICAEAGTLIHESNKRFSILFVLSYGNKDTNIKVEINKRNFNSSHEEKKFLGLSMLLMTQRDMTAHKLVAMYERVEKTKRDLFDVWFMLKKIWPINEEVITLRTNLSMKYFYKELVKKLESIPDNKILDGLGELLTTEQKDWVKDHLRKETRFLLESKMEEIKMSERIDNL